MAGTVAKAHKNMFSTACDCIEQKCCRELVHGYSTELDRDRGREECVWGGKKAAACGDYQNITVRNAMLFFNLRVYLRVCVGVCGTRERKICKIYSDAIQCQK